MVSAGKNHNVKQRGARAQLRNGPNWPLLVLAVLGMALSAYLTVIAWQGKLAAFCSEGAGCDIVLSSRWSFLFGMPTSFWGFLAYALLAAVAWNRNAANQWRWAWVISLFGLLFSVYLTAISIFQIKETCPYCLTSLAIMATIFVMTTLQRPEGMARFSWGPLLGKTVGASAVAIVGLHLYFAGYVGEANMPEDPWVKALAEHLNRTEAKFYGASWCPHCQDQKKLFGSSVKRIPYVECSPGGPKAPQASICKEKDIKSYPTWVINGQRETGVLTLDTLAQLSRFSYQGAQP